MVENKEFQKYQYAILVGSLTFVGLIIVLLIAINPLYKKAKSITTEAKTKQETLTKLKDKKAKLEALKSREDELKANAKLVEGALPTSSEAGRLFIQMDGLAKASKGKVNSVSIGANTSGSAQSTSTQTTENISKITYSMPIEFSSYFDFKDFITKTEGALRLVDIQNVNINSGQTNFSVNLTADTFTRK